MSNQILSGPEISSEEDQDYIWVPNHNVNSKSKEMYISPGHVNESGAPVDTPITVKKVMKNYNINMIKHCIFCLRRTTANQEAIPCAESTCADQLKEVPCAPSEYSTSVAPLLFAFNKIWNLLQKGGYWNWYSEGNAEEQCTEFTSFPQICYYCATNFSGICKLMSQLKAEINKLASVIRESKIGGVYSWRAESFEQTLTGSAVETQFINDTLDFLDICQKTQSFFLMRARRVSINQSNKKESSNEGDFNFHDEGSEVDSSVESDTNTDPNYIKEEEDIPSELSDSDESDSPSTEDFDEDPLDDNKSGLDPSLTKFVAMSTGFTLPEPISAVKAPSKHATFIPIPTVKDPTPKETLLSCTISRRSRGKRDWKEEIKIHQQKEQETINKQEPSNEQQQQPNVCRVCGKSYASTRYLSAHIIKFHSKSRVETLKCDLCKIQVPKNDLYKHVLAHVGEEYLIRCPNPGHCSFVCCTAKGLRAHLLGSETCKKAIPDGVTEKYLKPRETLICQVCGENHANSFMLRCHLNLWHEQDTKEFACPIQGCPQRFSIHQSLLLHIHMHVIENRANNSAQRCEVCKVNVKCDDMEQHLKDKHLVQEVVKCFRCPLLFSDRKNLVDHLYQHRHVGLFCDICGENTAGATFINHHDLRRHYFAVHQIGSKFPCEHCQAEFFTQRLLERHLEGRHPEAAAPRKESGCSSSAVASVTLADKIFKCDECDVVYKYKRNLTAHKMTIHEGKLLPCKFCDQKFDSFAKREIHEGKHRRGTVGIKEMFPCQVPGCGKQFSKKDTLKKHVSWAHEGQNPNV